MNKLAEFATQHNCNLIDSSYKGLLYALYFTTAILWVMAASA